MGQAALPPCRCKEGCISISAGCLAGAPRPCQTEFCDTGGSALEGGITCEEVEAQLDAGVGDVPSSGHRPAKWQWISTDVDCGLAGLPLGVTFDVTSPEAFLFIRDFEERSALKVARSTLALRRGDLLLEVNGERGEPESLRLKLEASTALGRTCLTFVRVHSPEALTAGDWEAISGVGHRGVFGSTEAVGRHLSASKTDRDRAERDAPCLSAPAAVVVKEASGERKPASVALPIALDAEPVLPPKPSTRSRVSGGASPSTPGVRTEYSTGSHLSSWTRDTPGNSSRPTSPIRGNLIGRWKELGKSIFGFASGKGPAPANGAAHSPLLLHFDVNKTIIHSDSISTKNSEDGVREAVSDIFWGFVTEGASGSESTASSVAPTAGSKPGPQATWVWCRCPPHLKPPTDVTCPRDAVLMTYFKFCKKFAPDKDAFKGSVRSFCWADAAGRADMERVTARAIECLRLPEELTSDTVVSAALREVGLVGSQYFIVPTLFHLVATLQREGREFAVLFRSFGKDHEKIKAEWNAFCELRHPIFSRLIADLGPMDGSGPLPDRRVHTMHTLYRDSQGPVLILDTFTNGPEDKSWDSWAKAKPRPKEDTRGGREYIEEVLRARSVEGLQDIQKWMGQHLSRQATSAIKDDWAWWQFHGEAAAAGKLLPLLGGDRPTRQVFFDDNIDLDDPRIVDCRAPGGEEVPHSVSLSQGMCVKVNPVEAVLDNDYFYNKLEGK